MADELVDIFKFAAVGGGEAKEEDVKDHVDPEEDGHDDEMMNYFDVMKDQFEANDTRIAMIGNVDSVSS